jgi:hypothetical protein
MKRLLIAATLGFAFLGATSSHVAAAGVPLLPKAPATTASSNDYSFYTESCNSTGTLCGVEIAYNNSSAPLGPPTGAAFGCIKYTPAGIQEIVAIMGNYGEGEFGTGSGGGVAGIPSPGTIFSNLVTKSNLNTEGYVGAVSGTAIGILKYASTPEYENVYPITGGKIMLNMKGAMATYNYEGTGTTTTSQGSMSCSISPSDSMSYVETPYYTFG